MQPKYWVNDKTRLCRVTTGQDNANEAIKDGFREVSGTDLDAFRAATRQAQENGWKPTSRKPFDSFLNK